MLTVVTEKARHSPQHNPRPCVKMNILIDFKLVEQIMAKKYQRKQGH